MVSLPQNLKLSIMLQSINREKLVPLSLDQYFSYGLAESSKVNLSSVIRTLTKFMETRGIEDYVQNVGNEFLKSQEKKGRTQQTMAIQRRAIFLLQLLMEGRPYTTMSHRIVYQFSGEISKIASEYLKEYSIERRLSQSTIREVERRLGRFCESLKAKGIEDPRLLDLNAIKEHFSSTTNQTQETVYVIRRFVYYLSERYNLDKDMYIWLKEYRIQKRKKLPSIYSEEEIKTLENSIPRRSPSQKRNYAMILLASRLGLRSSDIVNLQFQNIDWDRNIIKITQYKTGENVTLPLLLDVGDAIVDYIMNGRQKSNIPYIFLTACAPIRKLQSYSVGNMVHSYLANSEINITGRKSGAHALRHSLATNLLGKGVKLPVISGILGHSSTESTQYYLGVDMNRLSMCTHDVNMIPQDFYEQKGGIFYE